MGDVGMVLRCASTARDGPSTDKVGGKIKKLQPSKRLTVHTAADARYDHRGTTHPMAKYLPIDIRVWCNTEISQNGDV